MCFAQPLKDVDIPSGYGMAAQHCGLSEMMKSKGARDASVSYSEREFKEDAHAGG